MKIAADLYIDGEWTPGTDRVAVHNPVDNSVIIEAATAGPEECEAALAAAEGARASWAATASRVRAEVLRRAFDIMTAEADRFAELITLENGKVLGDARGEVTYAAEFFRWFSEEAVRVAGDFRLSPSGDKRIVVTHQPVGPSLLITPWNFPAAMATRKIGPALAAGCTMVIKPPTETPLTTLAVVEVLERAGLPKGVVNVILPVPVGAQISSMLHDPRVTNLSFTGSTEVGRLLAHECSDRIVRTSLELGGNAPFIVLSDADIDRAVEGAMIAKMRNGGSACTAANRFIVSREVADEFTSAFSAAMAQVTMGPGLVPGSQLGPLVSVKERDKVANLVALARDEGAIALTGGDSPEGVGAFFPATVLGNVAPDATILSREIFGPVAPIVTVGSDEEAIALANNAEYGLISYVFSGNLGRALTVAERLDSGMVAINRGVISDPAAPFGGMKQSGIGREGGFAGIHEFLETKYIGIDL